MDADRRTDFAMEDRYFISVYTTRFMWMKSSFSYFIQWHKQFLWWTLTRWLTESILIEDQFSFQIWRDFVKSVTHPDMDGVSAAIIKEYMLNFKDTVENVRKKCKIFL